MGGGGSAQIKETADEREMARIAAEQWNIYQQHYVPLENFYMQKVFETRSPAQYGAARSMAQAEYSDAFAPEMQKYQGGLVQRGANPNSGAFESPALEKAYAASVGKGMANAQIANTNRFYRGLEGVIAMGRGQSGSAMEGLADVAGDAASSAASAARRSYANTSIAEDVTGGLTGAGSAYLMNKKSG